MQFFSVLPRNLTILLRPELLRISKAIDLRCQSIEYAWVHAVGRPKAPTSHVLCAQPKQTLEKAGLTIAWQGIDYRTMGSKASASGAIWMVKTAQARDKPAHRSHQAQTLENTTCLRPQELKHSKTRVPGT